VQRTYEVKALPTNEDFDIPREANLLKKPITLLAITLSNNRKSISAQLKKGTEATKKRKRTL
jgi:hypothetical protein